MTKHENQPEQDSVSSLQTHVREFCEARHWDPYHSVKNLTIGVVTEAAELTEPFRCLNDEESLRHIQTAAGRENLEDEMADVLFFLLRISDRYHVDLGGALLRKMRKTALKYPAPTK